MGDIVIPVYVGNTLQHELVVGANIDIQFCIFVFCCGRIKYIKRRLEGDILKLYRLKNEFSICKIEAVDSETLCSEFAFLAKTDDELSLVCETEHLPGNIKECENGWNALKIDGVLDFSLTGVISKISGIIAEQGLGIFVISTFNTDYILMKKEQFEMGCRQLIKEGYEVI